MWGVSRTHPVLVSSLIRGLSLTHSMLSSFFFFIWGVSLTHPVLVSFIIRGVSLTHPMLVSFLSGEFLLHIPCWFHFFSLWIFSDTSSSGLPFHVGRFSYTSLVGFIFIWGVSLTHPMLVSFLSGEFFLHIPCSFHFYLGSFSYTSHARFIFIWGISLTHPMLVSFLSGQFFGSEICKLPSYALSLSGEFLLHIPCWLYLYLRSFS